MAIGDLLSRDDTGAVRYPGAVLTEHVAIKGLQTGAVLSTLATIVVSLRNRKNNLIISLDDRAQPLSRFGQFLCLGLKHGRIGFVLGPLVATSALLGMAAMKEDMALDGIQDRAFRLEHNKGQLLVDRFSFYGGAFGALSGLALPLNYPVTPIVRGLGGFTGGVTIGVAAYLVFKVFAPPSVFEASVSAPPAAVAKPVAKTPPSASPAIIASAIVPAEQAPKHDQPAKHTPSPPASPSASSE
eukprot:m.357096 g.357096  ORF g.357096 m.357096 type:complete len:242 (-) comp55965_c0_seq1:1413-2138(-)